MINVYVEERTVRALCRIGWRRVTQQPDGRWLAEFSEQILRAIGAASHWSKEPPDDVLCRALGTQTTPQTHPQNGAVTPEFHPVPG